MLDRTLSKRRIWERLHNLPNSKPCYVREQGRGLHQSSLNFMSPASGDHVTLAQHQLRRQAKSALDLLNSNTGPSDQPVAPMPSAGSRHLLSFPWTAQEAFETNTALHSLRGVLQRQSLSEWERLQHRAESPEPTAKPKLTFPWIQEQLRLKEEKRQQQQGVLLSGDDRGQPDFGSGMAWAPGFKAPARGNFRGSRRLGLQSV